MQPPRIAGVKVYDKNVGRNEIIMDLDLSYVNRTVFKELVIKLLIFLVMLGIVILTSR